MNCKEAVLLRIFFGEDDKYEGKSLYKYIVELCRKKGIAGVTVFRGVLGYGKSSLLHEAKPFKISSDLPIVVEIVDCEERIMEILPEIKRVLNSGLITIQRVMVLQYN